MKKRYNKGGLVFVRDSWQMLLKTKWTSGRFLHDYQPLPLGVLWITDIVVVVVVTLIIIMYVAFHSFYCYISYLIIYVMFVMYSCLNSFQDYHRRWQTYFEKCSGISEIFVACTTSSTIIPYIHVVL